MYKPIESYGVIGDMHSVALVNMDGAIDWCCLPYFDSPSIFAAILDHQKGGSFRIAATQESQHRQMYLPDSNVLVTRFLGSDGVGEVVDFMPVQPAGATKTHEIVRVARAIRGHIRFRLECRPAFDFARRPHRVLLDGRGAIFDSGPQKFALISRFPLHCLGDGVAVDFVLHPGESATFILRQIEDVHARGLLETRLQGEEALHETLQFWRNWLKGCRYQGRWREMVYRSALLLKLLTFQPTGAIVASPTCSLPETIGGERKWDYRYSWIRDAAFTVYAFLRLGFTSEAAAFMSWLEERARQGGAHGPLQVMYGIDGRRELPEVELPHLEGYRGSRPVRIGNAAAEQFQLDIYGELIDTIHLYNKAGSPISYDLWKHLRQMADWVVGHWEKDDDGIWETRGGQQAFVYSKVQCWVALDRVLKIAQERSFPINAERLARERDRIYETIMQRGYHAERASFVQHFGSEAVDAANLIMPLVQFVAPADPRMLGTLERTLEELVSDSLVHRYAIGRGACDGLTGTEGTFNMCTFWLVEALARAGRLDEARFLFEKMLTYANHLGLYGEELGPLGETLGNFPQAFTHIGLIRAAIKLDANLGSEK